MSTIWRKRQKNIARVNYHLAYHWIRVYQRDNDQMGILGGKWVMDGIPPEIKRTAARHFNSVRNERKPVVVCLCGSTRFGDAFARANLEETLAGKIVLTIGCSMRSDAELFAGKSERELEKIKRDLDELHKRKIDLADEVLILNVGGHIGPSTKSELEYAKKHNKRIRFLEHFES